MTPTTSAYQPTTGSLQSKLTNALIVFVHDYADPSAIDQKAIEEKAQCKIENLFKKQRNGDVAKKKLGKDFDKAISLYFNRFIVNSGVDSNLLTHELDIYQRNIKLHLKKDAYRYLKFLASIAEDVTPKSKGLLAS